MALEPLDQLALAARHPLDPGGEAGGDGAHEVDLDAGRRRGGAVGPGLGAGDSDPQGAAADPIERPLRIAWEAAAAGPPRGGDRSG